MTSDTLTVPFKSFQSLQSRCIIQAYINEFPVETLIDTGADGCYVSENLCNELNIHSQPYDCKVIVGNNECLNVIGIANITITIDCCNYPVTGTVVKTLSHPLILGWKGFIKKNEVIIDSAKGLLRLRRPSQHLNNFAFIGEAMILQPFTETLIDVQTQEDHNEEITFINRYEPLFQKTGVTVMPGLHEGRIENSQRHLTVLLTNLSSREIELPCFTIIATISGVSNSNSYSCTMTTKESENKQTNPVTENKREIDLSNTTLDDEQSKIVKALFQRHQNLFETTKRKTVAHAYHEIDTGTEKPIHNAPNRVGFKEKEYIQQQVTEMLENNIIQPSFSPWSSRIVLVKKKDGKLRFCIDYRGLNSITKKDVYPLPRIDDSLAMLQKGKFFTTLDLYAGYWQIPLDPKSKEKTAFATDSGLYEFNVMPFGLCNAPATFQRFMDATLAGLKWKNLIVYMDDIIIFSNNFDAHVADLEEVFSRLENANITLNYNKCAFFKERIHYLGYIVSPNGIEPNPDKVRALINKKSPSNIKELRNWLGISGFYRNFIPNYAKLCAPLYALIHKNANFHWTDKEENILEQLKHYLSSEPILRYPNFEYPFILRTDASIEALGATLSQIIKSEEQVIQYLSRTVQPNERHWCIQQLEALAIIWACETVRPYIIGSKVRIRTDHKSLEWLKQSKIPRLIRWACRLEEFDYVIEYEPGKFNKSADALSRLPDTESTDVDQRKFPGIEINYDLSEVELQELNILEAFQVEGIEASELRHLQQEDSFIQKFRQQKLENRQWILNNDIVFRKEINQLLLVLPRSLIDLVLNQYHNHAISGHRSRDRLYETLKTRFFWPGMYTDTCKFVKSCELCLKIKTTTPKQNGLLQPITTIRPFELVGIDIAYLPNSGKGFRYVLVAIDYFTNWVEAGLLKRMTAEEVIRSFFKILISRHGCPEQVISDSGSTFLSNAVKRLCECFHIKKTESSPYHPQCNGKVEKFIGFMKRTLALITPNDALYKWDELIDHCLYTYRTSVNRTIKTTPFMLLYGRESVMPQDLAFNLVDRKQPESSSEDPGNYQYNLTKKLRKMYDDIYKRRLNEQENYKSYYDMKHVDVSFKLGDNVLILFDTPTKGPLTPRWEGPYVITEKINPVTYKVENDQKIIKVHVQRMKLANNIRLNN